jgi:hypothetical protein
MIDVSQGSGDISALAIDLDPNREGPESAGVENNNVHISTRDVALAHIEELMPPVSSSRSRTRLSAVRKGSGRGWHRR